ncbi:MAG: hypothetical protein MRY57_02335 [Candidatus Pacebacteria bacterium]|nr:hypothetical protein [Candidatus Paceibacterota bacterium]
MKTNEIRVIINAPTEDIFEFTLEPKNTKHWVEGAVEMTTDTEQIGIGTKYSNEYITREVIDYDRDKFLELKDVNGPYICSYSFRKIDDETTELIFFESHEDGTELEYPLEEIHFKKLKELLEK